jgi:hypothetical protein
MLIKLHETYNPFYRVEIDCESVFDAIVNGIKKFVGLGYLHFFDT